MEDKYTPDEFRKCARLRGVARSDVIACYIGRNKKQQYTEEDFIACYRLNEMAGKVHPKNLPVLDENATYADD